MPRPSRTAVTAADDIDSNSDIIIEIDKFLEGYTSDGAEIIEEIVNENIQVDNHDTINNQIIIPPQNNASILESYNTTLPTGENEVEYIAKNSAIFQLLEDDENYVEYEHVSDECNWNILYQAHSPEEKKYNIKDEPKDDTLSEYSIQNGLTCSQIADTTVSIENIENYVNCQQINIKLEPLRDDISEQYPIDTVTNKENNEKTITVDPAKKNCTIDLKELQKFSFSIDNLIEGTNKVNNPTSIVEPNSTSVVERQNQNQVNCLQIDIKLEPLTEDINKQNQINIISNKELTSIPSTTIDSTHNSKTFLFSVQNIFQLSNVNKASISNPNPNVTELERLNQGFEEKNKHLSVPEKLIEENIEEGELIDSSDEVTEWSLSNQNSDIRGLQPSLKNYQDCLLNDEIEEWNPHNQYSGSDRMQPSCREYEDNRHSNQWPRIDTLPTNYTFKNNCRKRFKHQEVGSLLPEPHSKNSPIDWSKGSQFNNRFTKEMNMKTKSKNYLNSKFNSKTIKNPNRNIRNPLKFPTKELPSQNEAFRRPYSLNPNKYKRREQNGYCNMDRNDFRRQQCNNNPRWDHPDLTVRTTQPNSNCTLIEKQKTEEVNVISQKTNINNNTIQKDIIINNCNNNTMDLCNVSHIEPLLFKEERSLIEDYLSPESLVGSTIKFSSRKLANTGIREKILDVLTLHGVIENSWWTPDDMFFAKYNSRNIAQYVYKIYPKNKTNSYY